MGEPIQTLSTLDASRVAQGFISFTQWALTRSRQGRWLREHEPEAMLHRLQAIDDCSRFIHALALAHEQGRAPEGVQDCVTFVLQTCCDVWSWIESTAASA